MESRTFRVNESLSVVMKWETVDRLFVGKSEQRVGRVVIELDYACNRLLGRCIDEGRIVPKISGAEGMTIYINTDKFEFGGKLKGNIGGDASVKLEVGAGRGYGKMTLAYDLIAKNPEKEGRYAILLAIYHETNKGERKILGEPIRIDLRVVRPFIIEQFSIEPSSEYYVVGDPLNLALKILSEYDGVMTVECGGILRKEKHEYKIAKGSNSISIITSVESPGGELSVIIKAPAIGFEEHVKKKIDVRDRRIHVELIEMSDARLGKGVSALVKLINMSKIHDSRVDIAANIYGFDIEMEEVLPPGEAKVVQLKTPALTTKSYQHLEGEISVFERGTGQRIVIPLKLVEPAPLPLELKMQGERIEIPTNGIGKIELYAHNYSDLDINIVFIKISSKLCHITRKETKTITPYGSEVVDVEIKPLSPGKERATLVVGVAVGDTVIEERIIEFDVEIKRSFHVKEVKVLHPSKTKLAVKNQRVDVEIRITALFGKVDVIVRSPDMSIENQHYQVYPPETVITVSGRVRDYCEGIKIALGDGLIEEEIVIPVNVKKPHINCEVSRKNCYVGIKNFIVVELTNPFEVPLDVEVNFESKNDVEIDNAATKMYMEQLGKREVIIGVTGLSEGTSSIRLRVVSRYLDEVSKVAVDEWAYEQDVVLKFDNPISIEILGRSRNGMLLPYPVTSGFETISAFCDINMLVRNDSGIQLPEVSIESRIVEALGSVEIQPKILTLPPRGIENVKVKVVVPANYRGDAVKVRFNVNIGRHSVVKRLIELPVSRYPYSLVEIEKEAFDEENCLYPRIYSEGKVYALIPLTESGNVCGKPLVPSAKKHAILQALYASLSKALKSYESPWEAVASIMFKKFTEAGANYERELKTLSGIPYDEEGIIIIPALLWALVAWKNVGYPEVDKSSLTRLLGNMNTIGLLYVKDSPMYKVNKSTFYYKYLRFAVDEDDASAAELRDLILRSINSGRVDPLYLLYILIGGKHLQYSQVSEAMNGLFKEKRYEEFLMCLALTDIFIVNDIDILNRLEVSLRETMNSKTIRRSTILTLSLLLIKLMTQDMEVARKKVRTPGGVRRE